MEQTLGNIMICFAVGIVLAVIYLIYIKKFQGGIVRKILEADALSPQTAVLLTALGYKDSGIIRHALREGSSLSQVVKSADNGKYYIPREMTELAEKKYRYDGTSVWVLALLLVALLFTVLLCAYLIPKIISGFKF